MDTTQKTSFINRLAQESSPYLISHAHNPVDWYPWGDEAFERARAENKPVFLSVGYSTCHWCHVMARESFENKEIAILMNQAFISVKVDREERPDIDKLYMAACQRLTGSGGWPLTVIMTPERKPFFAATYIPGESRFGMKGMRELIPLIRSVWENDRQEVDRIAEQITASFREPAVPQEKAAVGAATIEEAFIQLSRIYDSHCGGFGRSPKFPTPHSFCFLLRFRHRTRREEALRMVEHTLIAMRMGGIYDQIGFGFHRYSTDAKWLVPHFEKMLYDQALLMYAYVEAYQVTKKDLYKTTAEEIAHYVRSAMTDGEGGFYSAEDADSEGVEGKFYLWTKAEIEAVLDEADAAFACEMFGIEKDGNFLDEIEGRKKGVNIPYLRRSPADAARHFSMTEEALRRRLETVRDTLFHRRNARIHPDRDDKILLDWNGLMIGALAKAGRAFNNDAYRRSAENAARFILERMKDADGRLLHRYRKGNAGIAAHLDDYAFFIWGLIELYEATYKEDYLRIACDLAEDMIDRFWDDKAGGFYFAPRSETDLLFRQKEIYDGAVPSGNSVSLANMIRLGMLSMNPLFMDKASELISFFSQTVMASPAGSTHFLAACDLALGPSYEIIVAGRRQSVDTQEMLASLESDYYPHVTVLLHPVDEKTSSIKSVADFTRNIAPLEGKATAYVCERGACRLPTTDIGRMLSELTQSISMMMPHCSQR